MLESEKNDVLQGLMKSMQVIISLYEENNKLKRNNELVLDILSTMPQTEEILEVQEILK